MCLECCLAKYLTKKSDVIKHFKPDLDLTCTFIEVDEI